MRKFLPFVTIGLMACSNGVSVDNDNPTGTVGGVVWDAATQQPIMGATVHILSGGTALENTTGMDGSFSVTKVPAGTLVITISAMMYQTASFQNQLSGSVGNFPVKNPTTTVGPIGLVRNDGTFTVRVVDQNGAPANGIKLFARPQVSWVNFAFGSPQPMGSYEVAASSAADGLATFMGMPNYAALGGAIPGQILVDVPPTQVMTSNSYNFLGIIRSFDGLQAAEQTPTIVLAGPTTGLAVIDSNIGNIGATAPLIPTSGPITMAFNQAIDPASVRASFQAENGMNAAVTAMATANTNLLTITASAGFVAGARYNLLLHVSSAAANANPAHELNGAFPFFIQPTGAPTMTVKATTNLTTMVTTVTITFSEPVGFGSHVGLSPVSCIAWYEGSQVNLNNGNTMNLFAGQWPSTGGINGIPCNASYSGFDITALTPKYDSPTTGFSTTWTGELNDGTACGGCAADCMPTGYQCQRPIVGNTLHALFSRVVPSSGAIHRVNGSPAPDLSAPIM